MTIVVVMQLKVVGGEDLVNLLQREALRLGQEDGNDGHPGRVEDGEESVGSPADVLEGRRSELDDGEVADLKALRGRNALSVGDESEPSSNRGLVTSPSCSL